MLSGLLIYFLFGWGSCTNKALYSNRMKGTLQRVTILRADVIAEIRNINEAPHSGHSQTSAETLERILSVIKVTNDWDRANNLYHPEEPAFWPSVPKGEREGRVHVYLGTFNGKACVRIVGFLLDGPSEPIRLVERIVPFP